MREELRVLHAAELTIVTDGCCCGMPGCEEKHLCGPEMHTDLIPNLLPTDLTNFKPFLIARTLVNNSDSRPRDAER